MATIQGRGQIQDIELAADADGKITAVRANLLADMGAYLQLVTPGIPLLGAFLYHGVYDIPAYYFTCTSVFTNLDAHRRLPGRRAGPRRPTPSSGPWTALAGAVGVGPGRDPPPQLHPTRAVPLQRRAGAGLRLRRLRRAPTPPGRSSSSATTGCRPSSSAAADGDPVHLGIGIATYVEMCGLAPSGCWPRSLSAPASWEAADRAAAAHRQGAGGHRPAAPRPGPGDVLVDDHGRQVRRRPRRRRGAPLRHRRQPHRAGHLRQPLAAVGGVAVDMAADKVLDKARAIAAHQARVHRGRPRARRRRVP